MRKTYGLRHLKVEKVYARDTAQKNGNRRRKVLGNVVRVIDDQRDDYASGCLKSNGGPHHPVVANKEPSLRYNFAIFPDHTKK